jgi:signal peptidase I
MENETKQGQNNFGKKLVTDSWLEKFVNSGSGWLIIISGSMAPLIQIKDQIFIKKTSSSQIHLGDIITFWQGNMLVTHRVIRKFNKSGNTYFVEKGDANANYSWVAPRSLIGKVTRIKRGDREIILDKLAWRILNRTIGFFLLGAYGLRAIGRKTPIIPNCIKSIVREAFNIAERLRDKIVSTTLGE